jgi:hypothetical protein
MTVTAEGKARPPTATTGTNQYLDHIETMVGVLLLTRSASVSLGLVGRELEREDGPGHESLGLFEFDASSHPPSRPGRPHEMRFNL